MTYNIVIKRRNKNLAVYMDQIQNIYEFLKINNKTKEHFVFISDNGILKPFSISTIVYPNEVIANSRDIFIRAIKDMATSIIICHNHPTGLLKPSHEDIDLVNKFYEIGNIIGLNITDYIIFNQYGYFSLRKEGYLESIWPKSKCCQKDSKTHIEWTSPD